MAPQPGPETPGNDLTNAGKSLIDSVAKVVNNKYVVLLLALGTLVALVIITVLIIKRVLKSSLQVSRCYKDFTSGNGPAVTVAAGKVPSFDNGGEFAYSFWVYAQSDQTTTYNKLVLAHAKGNEGFYAYIGKDKNELVCQFGSTTTTAKIDYLPMNRWVHVVVVYNNGTVTFFEDGEVQSVHGLGNPFNGKAGDLTIGGGADEPNYDGFTGYVGFVSVMNFQPSPGLVKRLYNQGPLGATGLLSVFGIPGYGLRNPVYKLNMAENADEAT